MKTADLIRQKLVTLRAETAEFEGMLSELEPAAAEDPAEPMAVLARDATAHDWLLGGVIGKGTLGMIVADPHVGKSTLMIQVCLALAAGQNALGWRIATPRTVLYCFAEGARALVAERIRACARTSGIGTIPPTGFVQAPAFSDFYVTTPGFRRLIERVRPDFAVLDALGYFFPGNENSAVEWKRDMVAPLMRLAADFGTAFCIVHHQAKESEFRTGWQKLRGTVAMYADSDWFWRLEGVPGEGNEGKRLLIVDKNKFGVSGQRVPLTFDKPGAYFSWVA